MERYDRQMRLWGHKGQERLAGSRICVIGISSVTVEMLKDFALSGIQAIYIIDTGGIIGKEDLSLYYFLEPKDIGKKLGHVTSEFLKELNKTVEVLEISIGDANGTQSEIKDFIKSADFILLSLKKDDPIVEEGNKGKEWKYLDRGYISSHMKTSSLLYILGCIDNTLFQAVFSHSSSDGKGVELRRHERGKADIVRHFYSLEEYGTDFSRCTRISKGRVSGLFPEILGDKYKRIFTNVRAPQAAVIGGIFAQMVLGCVTMSEGYIGTVLTIRQTEGFMEEWKPGKQG